MTETHHLGAVLIEQSQAQKEVTVNEAISRIDAMLNTGAKDKDITIPPGSPANGDVYLVGASATGDWSGHDDEVAFYDQIWRFVSPRTGVTLWLEDEERHYVYDGSAWQDNTVFKDYSYAVATNAVSSTAATLDVTQGNVHELTLTDNCTLTFSGAGSDAAHEFALVLYQDATGSRSVTWPASVKWAGGSAPTLTSSANAIDWLAFLSIDGGATWLGRVLALDLQ